MVRTLRGSWLEDSKARAATSALLAMAENSEASSEVLRDPVMFADERLACSAEAATETSCDTFVRSIRLQKTSHHSIEN